MMSTDTAYLKVLKISDLPPKTGSTEFPQSDEGSYKSGTVEGDF